MVGAQAVSRVSFAVLLGGVALGIWGHPASAEPAIGDSDTSESASAAIGGRNQPSVPGQLANGSPIPAAPTIGQSGGDSPKLAGGTQHLRASPQQYRAALQQALQPPSAPWQVDAPANEPTATKTFSIGDQAARPPRTPTLFADVLEPASMTDAGNGATAHADWVGISDGGGVSISDEGTRPMPLYPNYSSAQFGQHGPLNEDGSVTISDGSPLMPVPDETVNSEGWATASDCQECEQTLGPFGSLLMQWNDNTYYYGNLWHAYRRSQTAWARARYLYWETDGDDLPPLVTVSPGTTPQGEAGVLGQDTTDILFGGEVNEDARSGGRLEFGYGQFQGLQVDLYALEEESTSFQAASTGDPIIARPFFNIELEQQDASLISCPSCTVLGFPNINLQGNISIETTSEVKSAGISWRRLVWMDTWAPFQSFVRLNFLAGYRYFELHEGLTINDQVNLIGVPFPPDSFFAREDTFRTVNEFHGGEIGWLAALQHKRLSVELLARLALGNMQQVVDIAGRRIELSGDQVAGGFLAQPSNIGRHVRDEFALIPEFGIDVGFQIACHVRLVAGYSFIYVSQATRPGDNIDLTLNETTAGGGMSTAETRPVFTGSDSDFWAGGGSAGIELRW